jgi:hypothetical protein
MEAYFIARKEKNIAIHTTYLFWRQVVIVFEKASVFQFAPLLAHDRVENVCHGENQ